MATASCCYGRVLKATDHGIRSDQEKVQTEAIQKLLDKAAEDGSEVLFPAGVYVTGTIYVPTGVTINLDPGATLLGSLDPYDYAGYATDTPEVNLQADKCSKRMLALICSHATQRIAITGHGTIDGRGLEVALAIDSLHHIGQRIDPTYNTRRMRPSIRPKLIDFDEVDTLLIEGISLRASASWGLSLNKCNDVTIRDIDFINRAYWNNDGIDIADCHRVLITGCRINSADDGIVLKSFDPLDGNEDVTITDCEIRSSANAVKLGTESFGGFRRVKVSDIKVFDTFRSAIALESVDGAKLEDVTVDNVTAVNTGNAIFIRLGHRRGEHPGTLKNVSISNLTCEIPFGRPDTDYDLRGPDINTIHNPFPSSITGLPDAKVENIVLSNINISYPGRGTRGMAYVGSYRSVPEQRAEYPEFHMFGELPAWGFFLRHIDGITFDNVKISVREPDCRHATFTEDVTSMTGFPEVAG
ncbi:MAG: right-handed parallel beta-helix repeat-containing protein [Muribaculaceae bacterium]|nr:right-handed parallel beta-helix repeat-containing protein [Muribaculaceae bacterium]